MGVPIETYFEGQRIKFRVDSSFKTNKSFEISNYSSQVFENVDKLSKPIRNVLGLNLNMDYLRSYSSYFGSEIFEIAKNIATNK